MYHPTDLFREFMQESGKKGVIALSDELGYSWVHFYHMMRHGFRPAAAIATATLLDRPLDELFERVEEKVETPVG